MEWINRGLRMGYLLGVVATVAIPPIHTGWQLARDLALHAMIVSASGVLLNGFILLVTSLSRPPKPPGFPE